MQITKIIASAGRTFNHPHESYANFRPSITIEAELQEGDDLREKLDELHLIVEADVERVKNAIIDKCNAEYEEKWNKEEVPF